MSLDERCSFITDKSNFYFKVGSVKRTPLSFRDECIYECAKVFKETPDIALLLSGGLDSEVLAKCLIDASIPFEAWSFSFSNGASDHEMYYIKKFCQRHGININIKTIPVDWLKSSEAFEMFKKSDCSEPIMLPHMKLMKELWEIKLRPIMGSGDVLLCNENGKWFFRKQEMMAAWQKFSEINDQPAPDFYHRTPELICAMLLEPEMQELNTPLALTLLRESRVIKSKIYKRYWPDLEPRQKFFGGENVMSITDALKHSWGNQDKTRVWKISVNELLSLCGLVGAEMGKTLFPI